MEHIEAIVADASGLMLDHAVNAAFQGELPALETAARRALARAGDANALLGAALRHALALRRAQLDRDAGAQARMPYGGGFGRTRIFETHLRAWSAGRLARAIEILAEAVDRARREPRLAHAVALRALWRIAFMAGARAPTG
jgi:DNA polymerase-3 subunit delta